MLRTKMSRAVRPGSAAFTLTESMIALGLISVIVMAVMQFVSNTSDTGLYNEAINARMSLSQSLTRTVSSFDDLLLSANKPGDGNAKLRVCLGLQAGTCAATSAASPQSFDLYAVKGTIRVAGTEGSPVTTSRTGASTCTPGPNCPFWQTKAYFFATCPNNTATCSKATTVGVKFKIDPAVPEFNGQKLKGQEYTAQHRVFQATLQPGDACDAGSEQIGLGADGQLKCKCRPGYDEIGRDANQRPICQGQGFVHCKKGQVLKGRNPDGSPYCVDVVQKCQWFSFAKDNATCPNAGWLERLDMGYCRPAPKKDKKATSRAVKCDNNRGYCCFYQEK